MVWAAGYLLMQSLVAATLFLAGLGGKGEGRCRALLAVLLLLACRGGEEELKICPSSSASCRWWGPPVVRASRMRWKEVGFLCSWRHGGELAEETSIYACVWVGVRASSSMHTPLLHDGANHMANKLVAMIRGHEDGHFSRCLASASTTSLLEASEEDPDRRKTPPCGQVVSSPAAGRRWPAS
jgi:hypothetical protein